MPDLVVVKSFKDEFRLTVWLEKPANNKWLKEQYPSKEFNLYFNDTVIYAVTKPRRFMMDKKKQWKW